MAKQLAFTDFPGIAKGTAIGTGCAFGEIRFGHKRWFDLRRRGRESTSYECTPRHRDDNSPTLTLRLSLTHSYAPMEDEDSDIVTYPNGGFPDRFDD